MDFLFAAGAVAFCGLALFGSMGWKWRDHMNARWKKTLDALNATSLGPLEMECRHGDVLVRARMRSFADEGNGLEVEAKTLLDGLPAFAIRPWQSMRPDPGANRLSLPDDLEPEFVARFYVEAADADAVAPFLSDGAVRSMLLSLPKATRLVSDGTRVKVVVLGSLGPAERTAAAVELAAHIAGAGHPLLTRLRDDPRLDEVAPAWAPICFEARRGTTVVHVLGVWREGPALVLHADAGRAMEPFDARWDERGQADGQLPPGLEGLVQSAPRGTRLHHDGAELRMTCVPDDTLQSNIDLIARLADGGGSGGAFR
ncbi:MAG: hypothetical protein AB8I08_02950 [Sandaracinaceae bacterium]